MNIKKYILFFLLTTTFVATRAQIIGPNLVQNPSFEEYYQCPNMSGQLNFAKYWWGISTEYYNVCGTNGVSVPSNFNGFQYPHFGNAYAGFALYTHNAVIPSNVTYTEPIKNNLKDSLIKNKRYCINYYVSLSESNYNSVLQIRYDSISAMFSVNQVPDITDLITCDTCAKYSQSIVTIDTVNWLKISGSIIANGGERYLTIGKFSPMIWLPITCVFYIYIDDVSVCECAYHINLGEDTKLCQDETMLLNASLPNATFLWQDGSSNATYEVKQPGTYWVRAYVAEYDITTSDTIVISAEDEKICNPPLIIPNFITPNGDGNNDNFQLGNADKYDISLQIYNRWGNLIYQTANYKNDFSCTQCADGVYYYLLSAKSKRNGLVKEYKGSLTVFN
ncbi:MAG: gliding motility-associated C-terminal domain-containing protein [Bacteroidales bacterium]